MDVQKTDEALLAGVVRGERGALEELYDRYERMIFSFAYRCTGNAAAAEEIVQDVFVKVWRTTARYDAAQGKVTTWLLTITRRAAIDYHRRNHKGAVANAGEEALTALSDPSPGPAHQVERNELRTVVHSALQELPPDQQVVVEHMYFRGLTQQQIADNLGISVGTVKSRVRLAMQKLREKLPAHEMGADSYV